MPTCKIHLVTEKRTIVLFVSNIHGLGRGWHFQNYLLVFVVKLGYGTMDESRTLKFE